MKLLKGLSTLAGCLIIAIAAQAQTITSFKYVAINFPGAASTGANGINNGSMIVGSYVSTAGHTHGFKLLNGKFTTIDFPGSTSTMVNGVNDYGDMVGQYTVSGSQTVHGFMRSRTGTFAKLNAPNAVFGTFAMGINNSLTIVGGFFSDAQHGFIWKNGVFTKFDAPTNASPDTILNGISNLGVIAGQVFSGDNWRGFFKNGSDLDFLQPFLSRDNEAYGVNGHGDVVACQASSQGLLALHPESGETESSEGFPKTIILKFPGAADTCSKGINYARSIVGTYQNAGVNHGFLAVPQ